MAARAKRLTRPPAKRRDADDAMFDEAEVQRALRASVKLQKRTSSTSMPSCPTFHPTPEQFRDPFAYIKSITAEGIAAGIVKIVPPEGATRARGRDVVAFSTTTTTTRSFSFGVKRRFPASIPCSRAPPSPAPARTAPVPYEL
jgi:histone demethylase JARID1